MPLNKKAKKVKQSMIDQYGKEKGEEVFYATANKRGLDHKTWEPEGGMDELRRCPHCKKELIKHSDLKYAPKKSKNETYTYDPEYGEYAIGSYSCQNKNCPHLKEKGYGFSRPIRSDHEVSEDVEIILDGNKFILEAGDKITIESKIELDKEYYDKEVENPTVKSDIPEPKERIRRKEKNSHLDNGEDDEYEDYEYSDVGDDSEMGVDTNLPKKKASGDE